VILFGVPLHKDAEGRSVEPRRHHAGGVSDLRHEVGEQLVVMADCCLDEYTDHGHCGVLTADGVVDSDATIERYARAALAQAGAGAGVIAPSGMMDGQVGAIRQALDGGGHTDVAILAYSAKYASALYGPFRDAVDVQIVGGGDRKGYQQDCNAREALTEVQADLAQGADMVMVKPALAYLDVIAAVRAQVQVPVAAYHVSGEYSMIKAAAANGWIDGPAVALAHLTAIKRAGADVILTYSVSWRRRSLDPRALIPCPSVLRPAAVRGRRAPSLAPGRAGVTTKLFGARGGCPRWRELARAGLPVRRRDALLRGSRRRCVRVGRRGPAAHRPGAELRRHHPRPCPPQSRRGRRRRRRGRYVLRPTAREMKLAEAITERVPSCEQVRFVNSGTEATMTALRLARGVTGRPKVIKFAGNYHGHGDALLAAGGSGVATLGLSGSAGVTEAAVSQTVVAPYNLVPAVGDDVACVIVEPVAANMGLVAPVPGFLEGLRAACDAAGALLVFDEVITGFRLGLGGAQAAYGVEPDLTSFGKVIGGGLPIGAFGGRAELMASLAPLGPVYQAGTLSGNPLATAAGLAALDLLDDDLYAEPAAGRRVGRRVPLGARAARTCRSRCPSSARWSGCTSAPPRGRLRHARTTDEKAYARFFHALLDEGVALAPGAYEVAFPGLAHDDSILDEVTAAASRAAATLT
jgi:glutamate-1-semialdehyde 2,1-aminomutase